LYCAVDIWTISLSDPCPVFLSPDEADRAARFRFDRDRTRWTRARSALRRVLASYLGVVPEAHQFAYGENGKPALPGGGIEFNLSHSGDFALVGVTKSVPVGVDIEQIRPNIEMAPLLRRLGETDLPETVVELYARWTRREARAKATGGQLFVVPSADVIATDISAPEGYIASVALVGFEPQMTFRSLQR
jgi:4'-phosphopantetheinyl transferase